MIAGILIFIFFFFHRIGFDFFFFLLRLVECVQLKFENIYKQVSITISFRGKKKQYFLVFFFLLKHKTKINTYFLFD